MCHVDSCKCFGDIILFQDSGNSICNAQSKDFFEAGCGWFGSVNFMGIQFFKDIFYVIMRKSIRCCRLEGDD